MQKSNLCALFSIKSCVFFQFKRNSVPVFMITAIEIRGSSIGLNFLRSINNAFCLHLTLIG